MKKHLALAMILLPVLAQANHDVTSLKYFGHEGGMTFSPRINSSLSHKRTNIEGFGNTKVSEDKFKGYTMDLDLDYGMSSTMSLGISTNWNLNSRFETTPATGGNFSRTQITRGLSDPTIKAKYRYMEGNWTADAFLNWNVKLKKETASTDTKAGNFYDQKYTGQTFTLGTAMYSEMFDGEVSVAPHITYGMGANWSSKSMNFNTGTTTTTNYKGDSAFGYGLDLNYRRHYNKMFADVGLNVVGGETFSSTVNSTEVESNGSTNSTTLTNTSYEAKYPWIISPKVLIGYAMTETSTIDATIAYSNYIYDTKTVSNNNASAKNNTTDKDWAFTIGYVHHM